MPIQASQVMRPSVWMLPNPKPITAATATKTAVHAPWVDTELKEIEMPSIPEAEQQIQSLFG